MTSSGGFPNFIIVGVAKAGTTSFYHYLSQHPDVFMSTPKEPRFFAYLADPRRFTGPGDERVWSRAVTEHDAYRSLFSKAEGARAIGEASVIYLPHRDGGDDRSARARCEDHRVAS